MPYNDLLEDEDELDLAAMDTGSMPGGMPNVPRNPDKEDPRQKIKEYLKRQEMRSADPEMRKMDRASLDELRGSDRDTNLINLFQKSAAQMGTIGGKSSSTAAIDDFSKNLMAQNQGLRGDIMGQRQAAQGDEDRQMKIRQYMADRMMSDEQKAAQAANQAAALKERQASRESTEDYRSKMLGLREKEIGAKAGKEKEATEGERKAGAFATRAQSVNDAYEAFIQQNPQAASLGTKDFLVGEYGGKIGSQFLSNEAKMSKQLEKEFIGSVLRPETGAAASDSEWSLYGEKYFPRAGDTPDILARKSELRRQNVGTMRTIAGKGAGPLPPQTQTAGTKPPVAPGTGGGTSTPPPVAGAVTGGGGLSPEEQAELDELERQFGGAMTMADPRARLEELRQRKRYAELKAKSGGGESVSRETSSPSASRQFIESFTQGSDIGENMPGGRFLADTGTKIGAGIAAAGKYPFSDKPYGQLYDESIAPSLAIRERERAADEASPAGSFLKGSLASLPFGGMAKAPATAALPTAETIARELATSPAAEQAAMRTVQRMDPFTKKMTTVTEPIVPPGPGTPPRTALDPFTKKPMPNQPSSQAMKEVTETIAPEPFTQGTGNFTYPGDTAKEKLMEYFARQKGLGLPTEGGGGMQKAGKFILNEAEDMLPYTARKGLQVYRKLKGVKRGD